MGRGRQRVSGVIGEWAGVLFKLLEVTEQRRNGNWFYLGDWRWVLRAHRIQ